MRPEMREFTRAEARVIREHRTPPAVQRYLFGLSYNNRPGTLRSFRSVVRHGSAHCLEAVIASAAILEQHGYPPLVLDLESQDQLDHVMHLYRSPRTGLWGTVAKSRDPGLCGRKAVFRTVRDLVYSYLDPYVDDTGRITGYGVGNLNDLGDYDWRLSRRNVWNVERYCIDIPHTELKTSDRRYRYWLKRFKSFKKRHPGRKPLFYPGRQTWLPGYRRCRDFKFLQEPEG
jgi:hypothetical protein